MIKLMNLQTDYGIIENPILMTIILLVIVVPGFFAVGFIGSKLITFFMISHKGSLVIGLLFSVVGLFFILLLGYTALQS